MPRPQRRAIKKKLQARHFQPCQHALSPAFQTLFAKLPGQQTCASCLIKRITDTLSIVRRQFERCGGIFISKERSGAAHTWWVDHWRFASLQGYQVVGLLEGFVGRDDVGERERLEAARAMRRWMGWMREGGVMPGMPSERGEDGDGGGKKEVDVELLVKYITMVVEKLVKEVEEEDRHGSGRAREGIPEIGRIEVEEKDAEGTAPLTAEGHQQRAKEIGEPGASTLRSCLKRAPTPDTPHINTSSAVKRVKLANCATVSSDHSNILAHPFAPRNPSQPTIETHRLSAFRESGYRKLKSIKRKSPQYKPGRWASPDGYRKQNTSWWKMHWWIFEELMRTEAVAWKVQWAEGSRMAKVFREIGEA